MDRLFAVALVSSLAIATFASADGNSQQRTAAQATSKATSATLPGLPPKPAGKSTVIGGAIRDVDPVRDQLKLNVFGGKPITILYDERTQIYRDGIKTPLRDLRDTNHASVETVLDGTKIFALSIHMLSRAPEGECQGQVVDYNPTTGDLAVSSALSREPIRLRVPAGASIVRVGQAASSSAGSGPSDLVSGALVSVKFESQNQGRGIVRQISILATPGSTFVFSGKIVYLDLHSSVLVLVDPRDNTTHKLSFDPARFPMSQKLHEGSQVRVTANFNGSGYDATDIQMK